MGGTSNCCACSWGWEDLAGYVHSVGHFCQTCVKKLGCRNCGLNWSKLSKFVADFPDGFVGGDDDTSSIHLGDLFGLPELAFRSLQDVILRNGQPDPQVHDKAPYREEDIIEWIFTPGFCCDDGSAITQIQEKVLVGLFSFLSSKIVSCGGAADHRVDLETHFDLFFSRMRRARLRNGNSVFVGVKHFLFRNGDLPEYRSKRGEEGPEFDKQYDNQFFLCKWCIERHVRESIPGIFAGSATTTTSVDVTQSEGDESDGFLDLIGDDLFGEVMSFGIFPRDIGRMNLVSRSWRNFFTRTNFGWLTCLVVGMTRERILEAIRRKEDHSDHQYEEKRILDPSVVIPDRWSEEVRNSSTLFHDADKRNKFWNGREWYNHGSYPNRMGDLEVWEWVTALSSSCPRLSTSGKWEGFAGLEEIVFADPRRNHVTDLGTLVLANLFRKSSGLMMNMRRIGFFETQSTHFGESYPCEALHPSQFASVRALHTGLSTACRLQIAPLVDKFPNLQELTLRGRSGMWDFFQQQKPMGASWFQFLRVLVLDSIPHHLCSELFSFHSAAFYSVEDLSVMRTRLPASGINHLRISTLPDVSSLRRLVLFESAFPLFFDFDHFLEVLAQTAKQLSSFHFYFSTEVQEMDIQQLCSSKTRSFSVSSSVIDDSAPAVELWRIPLLLTSLTLSSVRLHERRHHHFIESLSEARFIRSLVLTGCRFLVRSDLQILLNSFPDLRLLSVFAIRFDWTLVLHQQESFPARLRSLSISQLHSAATAVGLKLLGLISSSFPELRELRFQNHVDISMLVSFLRENMRKLHRIGICCSVSDGEDPIDVAPLWELGICVEMTHE